MKLELQLKLKQTLAPQLIQSLKMLQMPILKLEQVLRHELAINPLLEELEATESDEDSESELLDDDDEQVDDDKIDWDDYLRDHEDFNVKEFKNDNRDLPGFGAVSEQSLYEHLLEQLSYLKLSEHELEIGEFIIGNIDEAGYLSCSLEELSESLQVDADKIERILIKIQRFEPSGVGARNLSESLQIQLRDRHVDNNLAYRIVEEHLETLDRKSLHQVSKLMGVPLERIQEAMEIIKSLNPRPAYGRFTKAAQAVVPDLMIEKIGDEWIISHNDRNVPQLRVNSGYRELLRRGSKAPKETKKYVREKLEQARWLLNAINQRRTTMVRVVKAILVEQIEYFEKGVDFLRPLTMEQIADIVEMNVATISRVSSGKYVQTPHGVVEIKFFFNSGVKKNDGEQLTKRRVKQMIEKIIAEEDQTTPLSDQEIFKRLREKDISIARRTVTKYREELKILPARFRKRVT